MAILRKDYVSGKVSHDEYYSQFVTSGLTSYVIRRIGTQGLLNSHDEHLNDIPLRIWDSMTEVSQLIDHDKWREANEHEEKSTYPWSLSDQVCIAKRAAKQWIESNRKAVPQ